MGDETKEQLERNDEDPLHDTRKPTTADSIDDVAAQPVQLPDERGNMSDAPRSDATGKPRSG